MEHHILVLLVICYLSFFSPSFLFLLFYYVSLLFILFTTTTYCQLISKYYLANNYLLIWSLITLKIYLVYSKIAIFHWWWSNYVSPKLFFLSLIATNRYRSLWYGVSIWLSCILFFMSYTLQPSLRCWRLYYVCIWHHLIMVPRE